MNNRHIITISLYIILNSFFILIISQSKFNNNQNTSHAVNHIAADEKIFSQQQYAMITSSIEEELQESIWVFKKNFEGEYEVTSPVDAVFERNVIKQEQRGFLLKLADIVNKNKNVLKISVDIPEYPKYISRDKNVLLADLLITNIEQQENLTINIVPSNHLTVRIRADD